MLRLCNRARRYRLYTPLRTFSSSSSSLPSSRQPETSIEYPNDSKNSLHVPPLPPILHQASTLSPLSSSLSRKSLLAISATLISTIIASAALIYSNDERLNQKPHDLYADIENSIERSNDSVKKIVNRMKQTGVAAAVLWKSLRSVLSSANQEVRSGFELRVAALLADIAAANESRRSAIVSAGGGAVVDWLLEAVASLGDNCGTQAESARALAYLIADPNVCETVLGRPHAVPNLLRFIFSFQPQGSKKHIRRSSFDGFDNWKGRSMLVAAIMDIVTSNCDSLDRVSFQPSLPGNADMRDIAAAIEVIEEGGMHLDEPHGNENDGDGGKGMRGIGIKILGGTTVLGFSRTNGLLNLENSDANHLESVKHIPKTLVLQKSHGSSLAQENLSSISVPGLWDDLQSEHVAVPFAAWALANWAKSSDLNRSHIQELDQDGHAVMTALMAPERTVKWHGSLVAQLLLEDQNLPLSDSVSNWSSSLLSTVSHASKTEDIPLVRVALSAFLVSVERSPSAQKVVMDKGLHLMRETAKRTAKHKPVQETLARALELLCTGDIHLSLEESQKWSSILLTWVCGKFSSDTLRFSATKILSSILEYYGPSSIPISQGWLTILLTEFLGSSKTTSFKGSTQPKSDKVKTQIDQSNVLSAALIANQLAGAVVNLAGNQLGTSTDSIDAFPLADLLSMEPFAGPFKNLNKDSLPKFDAADSALATLKGIKALTEVCAEDTVCLNKIADCGILCLLRRFLLRDDYEQLAAIETYDASRIPETQERVSNVPRESSDLDTNDPSSVRVPPTAHIRKHAARLLTILSLLPKVQKAVIADEIWCKWLEDCASGRIPGCNDLKLQSYARAILLNIFCSEKFDANSINDNVPDAGIANRKSACPLYNDMVFLINPELPHWKCPENSDADITKRRCLPSKKQYSIDTSSQCYDDSVDSECRHVTRESDDGSLSSSDNYSQSEVPPLDIVFIHGMRGGPFKTWRIADDKFSTTTFLFSSKAQIVGALGGFVRRGGWKSRIFCFSIINFIEFLWRLLLVTCTGNVQEVSSMLLEKLVAAGIGNRPVVFVTHSMGGLVVKQMLYQAKADNFDNLVSNTIGVVFYSCPHFGSKLADMPWRMGLVFRPAPTIGELRSGSPRLVELNDYIRHLHKKGMLEVLSFSETKVTPIVEGYGGWAFRMEIVPIESAYPGFGELVVLESTDHINSCKPVSRSDPSYKETVDFLQKLKSHYLRSPLYH
ncbi:hypothetical protein HHK36_030903 [Tetracentron sinense]|uniref:GPI inositol-deacylase n=1 Tax=Tetracentron sinense TaxID=13715 RepID=A0A834YCZ6_TETSI|nr:hypothetical protein HHK36_030903 [Tetracentron sinense]